MFAEVLLEVVFDLSFDLPALRVAVGQARLDICTNQGAEDKMAAGAHLTCTLVKTGVLIPQSLKTSL